ncbi:hypothetical protein TFLX_04416 [Thermoflexales bacterium]|nr:hypothetical protein TFLX_04416 [Thermoflexales bacterium]
MPYTLEIALEAESDLAAMKAFQRVELLDVIDQHLTHTPTIISRSRLIRLRLMILQHIVSELATIGYTMM